MTADERPTSLAATLAPGMFVIRHDGTLAKVEAVEPPQDHMVTVRYADGRTDELGALDQVTVLGEEEAYAARRGRHRLQLTQGFRDLADFLDANPDLPLGRYLDETYLVHVDHFDGLDTDEARLAELVRLADRLGVEVKSTGSGHHHHATVRFGPISLDYIHITEQRTADHDKANEVYQAEMDRLRAAREGGESS